MRNLKKVLALALALAMTLTFFANAAFTDAKDIDADTKVAVDTLVALGVLAGDPDGSFRPADGLTRAEAAKIIYTIRNKGNADASGFAGQASKFTDVANHWAKGYIVYCESLGIVSGKTPTSFDPEGQVTGSELAKMLLTALGYKADIEGYTGASWELNVLSDATDAGLLDNYGVAYGIAAPRQWVALMTYNMLYGTCVKYDRDGNIKDEERTAEIMGVPVKVPMTGAHKFFGLLDDKGIVVKVDDEAIYVDVNNDGTDEPVKFELDNAYAFLGKEVKVLYKVAADREFSVYDAVVTAKNKIEEKAMCDLKEDTFDLDKDFRYFVNYAEDEDFVAADYFKKTHVNDMVTFIDNDNDGDMEYGICISKTFGKIGTVNDDEFYFSSRQDNAAVDNGTIDREDAEVYDGMKKGDYVFAYKNAALDKTIVEKASMEEGKVRGKKGDSFNIGGTYYDTSVNYNADALETGSTYEFYTDGKYVVFAEEVESQTPTNFAVIEAFQLDTRFDKDTWYVKVILNDGTDKEYEVKDNKVDETKLTGDSEAAYADLVGKIYTYSVSDGKIKLTVLEDAGSLKLAEDAEATFVEDDDTIGGMFINDDAVIFVNSSDGWDVVSGKEVKAWSSNFGEGDANMGFVEKNGMRYVAVGVLVDTSKELPGEDGDTLYGMLTSDSYWDENDDGDRFEYYELWNGKETVTVKREMDNDYDKFSEGDVVSYKLKANGEVSEIEANEKAGFAVAALTGFDLANDKVAINGTVYSLDDDCVIVYVNRDDAKGVASADLEKAEEVDGTTPVEYIDNIAVKKSSDGKKVVALFFDIDNNWDD